MREYTSWSEVSTARQCLKKHAFRYKEGWSKLGPDEQPLRLGGAFHKLLEAYYQGQTVDERRHLVGLAVERVSHDLFPDDVALLDWMLTGYLETHGWDDWLGRVVAVEQEITANLPDVGHGSIPLLGYADLIVRDGQDNLWLVDHKTGKQFPTEVQLEFADQFALYSWGLAQAGIHVIGSIHKFARTTKLKRHMQSYERFRRSLVVRSEWEIASVAHAVATQVAMAWSDNGAPASPGRECAWMCSYLEPCMAGRKHGPKASRDILDNLFVQLTEEERHAQRSADRESVG